MTDPINRHSQNPYASPQNNDTPLIGEGETVACAPCPRCHQAAVKSVPYRWWRGRQGPLPLDHVQCQACGVEYNGRTGRYNTLDNIVFYFSILAVAAFAVFVLFTLLAPWIVPAIK